MHFLFHWHQFMLTTLMINGECVYNWVGGIENHLHSLRLNLCKFSFCLKGETVRHAISNIKQFCASIQFVEETLLISSYGSRRQYSSTYFMSWFSTPYFAFVRIIAFRRTALYCQCNYVTIVLWIKAQVQPTQLKFNLTFNIKRKISTFIDNDNRSKWWNILLLLMTIKS